jgi:hypothetical protein
VDIAAKDKACSVFDADFVVYALVQSMGSPSHS